jgi:1-acyl-sn-glycerol-3-phosphate acyltransferase
MKIFAKIRHAQLIFSTVFYVAFYITIVSFNRKYVIKLRKWVSRRILTANDIHLKVIGEAINPEAKLFIANHQNMLDIMILELVIPDDVCWVAKRELFKIPFYGRAVSIPDMIAVDRSNKLGMKLLIRTVKDRIAKGRPVVIFPEGTRSKKDEFLSFKSGAQFIANQLDLTVQPIVISNTKKLLRPAQSELYPSTITIQAMPSFKASDREEKWLQDEKIKMQNTYNDIS